MADRGAGPSEPHVLREYSLVADGERGAVVGPGGEIAWLCFPSWHSDPVFASLLGGRSRYLIRPRDRFVWGGQYEEGTLIWRNRWVVGASVMECREALGYPGEPDHAVLIRRVVAARGTAPVEVHLEVADDLGTGRARRWRQTAERTWECHHGPADLRWTTPQPVTWSRGGGRLSLELEPGSHVDLVLELAAGSLPPEPADPDEVLRATTARWHDRIPELQGTAADRDARHAVAVLSGMTTGTGAMVAAATTSLPERADQGRNYDYRYAWIRDQCYVGLAAAQTGGPTDRLLDDAVRFVHQRLLADGDGLRPAYRTSGEPVPQQYEVDLPGYPGAPQVLIGNQAGGQYQLDAFGEALNLFAAAGERDRMHGDAWRAAEVAADAIERCWTEPGAGVWELKQRRYAHSRLSCAAGLRRAAAVAPSGPRSRRWLGLADAITAEVAAQSVHRTGRWQRAPDDERVDAALLLAGLRHAVAPDDPRVVATLAAVRRDLVVDGYAFRYRVEDRPLGQAEGAFLLCGFWLALACAQAGDHVGAARFFERNRAACGPAGIFTEEYDVHQRQLRGNLPQAFVHALLLESAVVLGAGESGDALRSHDR